MKRKHKKILTTILIILIALFHTLNKPNNESNSLTFFTVNKDEKTIIMNGPEIPVDKPNCVLFHKIG